MQFIRVPGPAPDFRDFAEASGYHLASEGCLYWRYRYCEPLGGWHRQEPDGTWRLADTLMEVA